MGTQYTQETRPYVLWRRVSTKQQGDSELGLEAQTAIAVHFMKAEPVKIYTDVYSGTKLKECRDLQLAIRYCKEHDYLLVVAKSDRFRNTIDGLTILDEVGEHNIFFCDLATSDRTVLTMMFSMWERQAIMGRINTRLALAERKKQAKASGYWISKTKNIRTHLGQEKGYGMDEARAAAYENRTKKKNEWKEQSTAYKFVKKQIIKGKSTGEIWAEFQERADEQPEVFCSRSGKPMTYSYISRWKKEIMEEIRLEDMA